MTDRNSILEWLTHWRDQMPADAVMELQDLLGMPAQMAGHVLVPAEPVAFYAGPEFTRWTLEWNGRELPIGTPFYALAAVPAQPAPVEQRKGEELLRTVNTQAMYQIGIDLRQNRRQSQGTSADRKNSAPAEREPGALPDPMLVTGNELRQVWNETLAPALSQPAATETRSYLLADQLVDMASDVKRIYDTADRAIAEARAALLERDEARALLTEAKSMLRHTRCNEDDALKCPACSLEARIEALT